MAIIEESPRVVAPTRPTFARKLVWSLAIRRIEFFPVWLSVMLIPALLSAPGGETLRSVVFPLTLLTVLGVVHVAEMVNTLADRDVDATYKSRLTQAAYGLGLRNVRAQIAVTLVVVAVLAVVLSALTGRWDLVPLIAVETFLVAQYSVPPLYFKTRGVLQPTVAVVIIVGLPMTIMVRALVGEFDWPLVAAIIGFGVAEIGIIVLNTAEDLPEDRAHGIRTSVVALGLPRAMALATGMVTAGGTLAVAGVLAAGGPTLGLVAMVAAVAVAAAHVFRTWRLVRGAHADRPSHALALLRVRAKLVPVLLATTGWATVLAAVFVLAGR